MTDVHHFHAVPEGRISIFEQGEGPDVVFLHGTPSGSHEFAACVDLLPDHRCLRFDHLGFGASDKPAEAAYDLQAHQRRTSAVLDALAPRDAVFVLHDFGASFALPWMLANPEHVKGVVLANTFLWPAQGAMRAVLWFYTTALGAWVYRRFNVSAKLLLPYAWGKRLPLTPEIHDEFLAPFANPDERWATSALVPELLGSRLGAIPPETFAQWPCRAVWGMSDTLVGPSELARWRAALPDLSVDEVEDAGHFVAYEAPEVLAAAIRGTGARGRDLDLSVDQDLG